MYKPTIVLYLGHKRALLILGIKTKRDIMEQNEQGQRNSAAKEFEESLDQLQHLLEEIEENQTDSQQTPKPKVDPIPQKQAVEESPKFDLAEWEDAVADIEQYFESKDKQA